MLDQPIHTDRVVCFLTQVVSQIGAQFSHGPGYSRGERHFGRVPARNSRQLTVGPFNKRLLHPGIDQSQDPSAEHEEIANLQAFDETFFNRAKPAPLQHDVDKSFGNDRPDIYQEFARHPFVCQSNNSTIADGDLPKDATILLRQGFAPALQIMQYAIELLVGQVVKWSSPLD